MPRCGTVALAGRPNAGKSTLLNALVGEHLAIVSAKPQSTRVGVVGIRTSPRAQLIFTDAPGLLEPRYRLHETMQDAARRAIADADVIVHLHPLADAPAPDLLAEAGFARAPRGRRLTVYTKADLVPPERRPPLPAGTVAVSAVTGEGIDALVTTLEDAVPEGPFLHDPDDLAAQPLRFFAAEYVREAAFEQLHDELPYSVAVDVDEFREAETPVYIRATVYVERESQKGIVIGAGGRAIKGLGAAARAKIEALLARPVYLDLRVKVLPRWRRDAAALKRLGYAP